MNSTLARPVRIARGFDERGVLSAVVVQVPLVEPGTPAAPSAPAWQAAVAAHAAGTAGAVPWADLGLATAMATPPNAASNPAPQAAATGRPAGTSAGVPPTASARGPGLLLVAGLKLLVGLGGLAVAAVLAWQLLGEPTAPAARHWLKPTHTGAAR